MKLQEAVKLEGTPSDATMRKHIKSGRLEATQGGGNKPYEITPEALESAYGVEAAKEKPKQTKELVIPSWDVYQNHPVRGLTPDLLYSYMLEMEWGEVRNMADTYDDILERDPRTRNGFETRKALTVENEWEVLVLPQFAEDPKAQEQVKFVKTSFENMSNAELTLPNASAYLGFDALLDYWMNAIGFGFSTVFIKWVLGKKWTPAAAKKVHMRHHRIGDPGENFDPNELRIRTEEEPSKGVPMPPYSYVTHYTPSHTFLTRSGIMKAVLWYYLFKYHGTKWMLRYAEIASVPFRLFKYDPDSSSWEEDLRKGLQGLRNMGDQGFAAIPMNSNFEFMDAGRSGSAANPPQQLVDFCDKAITTLWLGQTGTTIEEPGKLGNKKEAENVQDKITAKDAKALIGTVQRGLVEPMTRFNFGKTMCYFWLKYEPETDIKLQMEIIKMANDVGVKSPTSHVKDVAGIPETKPGEEETTPPPAGGGGQLPFDRKIRNAKKQRLQRDAKIRKEVAAIEDSAIEETLPLYDKLVAGLTEENYEKRLNKNKERFKKDYEPIAQEQLGTVNTIFEKNFPKPVKSAIEIDWNLADRTAAEFLEWQAFSMSVMEGEIVTNALLTGIKAGLQEGIEAGTTFTEFVTGLRGTIGIDSVQPHHLQTVWRTNLATAHSASVFDQQQRGDFPAWQLIAIDDGRITDICNDRKDNIYPRSNTTDMPPLHFQCRSEASLIDATELEEEGYNVQGTPAGATPVASGFQSGSQTSYNDWIERTVKDLPNGKAVGAEILTGLNKIGT